MRIREANSIENLFRVQALRARQSPSRDASDSDSSLGTGDVDARSLSETNAVETQETVEIQPHGKRRLQHVSTLADRHRVVSWMKADVEANGEKNIAFCFRNYWFRTRELSLPAVVEDHLSQNAQPKSHTNVGIYRF
jgi:hypothetical protein